MGRRLGWFGKPAGGGVIIIDSSIGKPGTAAAEVTIPDSGHNPVLVQASWGPALYPLQAGSSQELPWGKGTFLSFSQVGISHPMGSSDLRLLPNWGCTAWVQKLESILMTAPSQLHPWAGTPPRPHRNTWKCSCLSSMLDNACQVAVQNHI